MNEYDSDIVATILKNHDFTMTAYLDHADVILINTCAVRENAHQKIHARLKQIRAIQSQREKSGTAPKMLVGLLGCMAQNLKSDLLQNNSVVDILAGPDAYRQLPELISQEFKRKSAPPQSRSMNPTEKMAVDLSEYETYAEILPEQPPGINGWVAIMRGCNNFCTFCVVPYTRGRERSRSPASIIEEVHRLAEQGYRQITLLGQNVNSYRWEEDAPLSASEPPHPIDFADLLEHVARVSSLSRVRFTSPHPKDFPQKFLDVMGRHPTICPHIHLPLQAGSDRILDRMNRCYTQKDYRDTASRIRAFNPEIGLTTDIIVGFPGETHEEYLATRELLIEMEFHSAFIFKYSERRGTLAARKYPDDVPEEIKTARVNELVNLQRAITVQKSSRWIGTTLEVLVEGPSKKNSRRLMGRCPRNLPVIFEAGANPPQAGEMVGVAIEEVTASSLYGHLATPGPKLS